MRRARHLADMLDRFSYPSIFLLWAANVLLFATAYVALSYVPNNGPEGFNGLSFDYRVWDAIYYSIITATNTGYGDIVPHGFSRVFAAMEAFSGLFLFALFMAKLVSRKQDIAIQHMHRISFEGTFHDIREDLHTVRGDFDTLITIARERRPMSAREWEVLRVAYQQIGGLLREIPIFYDIEHHLYRIDQRRERLLVEAFHRTLERLDTMLAVFDEYDINWIDEESPVTELREFLHVSHESLGQWKHDASRSAASLFESLSHQADSIAARLAKAYPL